MLFKRVIFGLLLYSSFILALEISADGKPIYEPMDVTVGSMDIEVKPINITVYYPIGEKGVSADSDGDGISDDREKELGLNPNLKDSDEDGILDSVEIGDINSPIDTDGDGIIDALDLDSDNDGYSDKDEVKAGTNPKDKNDYPKDEDSKINLNNGLIAYYKFDGDTKDSSGNGNNGVEYGGVTYVDGIIGKAGSFDGVDDEMKTPVNNELYKSMSFWAYLSTENLYKISFGNGKKEQRFSLRVDTYKDQSETVRPRIYGQWRDGCCSGGTWDYYNTYSDIKVQKDGWYYFYIQRALDGDESPTIYINNQKVSKINHHKGGEGIPSRTFKDTISVGYLTLNRGDKVYEKGIIDDLRFYNRALNEEEIAELYKMGK